MTKDEIADRLLITLVAVLLCALLAQALLS